MNFHQPLSTIYLYDEPDAPGLDIEAVGGFLVSQFPALQVIPRSDFITHQFRRFTAEQQTQLQQATLKRLAEAQARVPAPVAGAVPTDRPDPEASELGLVFEAAAYQAILRLLVDPAEAAADCAHIVFTDNAIGSWRNEGEAFRLHIICMGEPSIISTTGLVEALPRPREYEFKRSHFAMFGADEDVLEDLAEGFANCTFGYGDARINELCKGYALMACFYRMFGEAFCDNPSCRLYAAQTQEELIAVQCGPEVGLCERHENMRRGVDAPA